jgi:phosphoribosylformylglycinamidine synthase
MGSETGVRIDLDSVPLKDKSLTAWEILLSESQERMLLAVPPEKATEARAILEKYEVGYSVLGHFTETGRLEAFWHGRKVVDLEMSFLWEACPIDPLQVAKPQRNLQPLRIPEPHTETEWAGAIRGVLGHYHCADQSAAGSRFDTTVQGRTAMGPYEGKNHRMPTNVYISAPLRGKPYGLITTLAFNPFYGEIDPASMTRLMIIEAISKAVAAGADYRQMVLCDNFYTPRVRPETAWDLREMVETIADMSVALGVPFISGKDSSSGTFETEGRRIRHAGGDGHGAFAGCQGGGEQEFQAARKSHCPRGPVRLRGAGWQRVRRQSRAARRAPLRRLRCECDSVGVGCAPGAPREGGLRLGLRHRRGRNPFAPF